MTWSSFLPLCENQAKISRTQALLIYGIVFPPMQTPTQSRAWRSSVWQGLTEMTENIIGNILFEVYLEYSSSKFYGTLARFPLSSTPPFRTLWCNLDPCEPPKADDGGDCVNRMTTRHHDTEWWANNFNEGEHDTEKDLPGSPALHCMLTLFIKIDRRQRWILRVKSSGAKSSKHEHVHIQELDRAVLYLATSWQKVGKIQAKFSV